MSHPSNGQRYADALDAWQDAEVHRDLHDRDFQRIKNEICGTTRFAVELEKQTKALRARITEERHGRRNE